MANEILQIPGETRIYIPNTLNDSSSSLNSNDGLDVSGEEECEECEECEEFGVPTAPYISEEEYIQEQQKQEQKQLQLDEHITVNDMCIICYENIDEKKGDFKRDLCNTCVYTVHIECMEGYIISQIEAREQEHGRPISSFGIKCLMCSKRVETIQIEINIGMNNEGNDEWNDELNHIQQMQLNQQRINNIERRMRISRIKGFICSACICSVIFTCGLLILLNIIHKI